MVIAMLVFDCAVVGFAGVKPLNITFTMARPLPIYPLKVPSYLFMPQAPGGVLPKGYGVIGSDDPHLSPTSGNTWSVHRTYGV